MRRLFAAAIVRELRLALRHAGDSLAAVLFFALAAALFPLALGPGPALLARMATGTVWVLALLAALLPLERLYGADHEDGGLDELLAAGLPAPAIAAAKMLTHWLACGVPVIAASVPVQVMLGAAPTPVGLAALALGTLCLSLIGGVAACVSLGARRGTLLLPLLALPLATAPLIFGAAAADAARLGLDATSDLALLAAFLCAALPVCPLAAGLALREG
ncbi:heme exporter protein B [Endobacter medicaginis]|uniref:Heme exporter protein B n=2 Tax=Endobacter medicaginis TaxID=1181271 RepID=A0A839UVR7_9PROT|nr:heme exporter protein CcmB [Endobacter medicaginis]MBB3172484.1 heme exporter protein B [Endobacter medicaginis]MCX5474027.1 heme exporter protein CcmB [Endobacter medicaginis]